MIEKLRKKLMVLFLTCTMLIFTAAMLVMAGNAVSQIRSAEIQYGNNLADSTLDFSVYTKSNAMVRLFDGTTTQSSPECFPTPLEVLIERTQESDTVLSMQEEAAENGAYGKSRTVYAISGNQKDGYYAIHSTVHNGKTMVLDLILFYPRASFLETLKNGCILLFGWVYWCSCIFSAAFDWKGSRTGGRHHEKSEGIHCIGVP